MSYSVLILLTLAFALANGKPAEPATAEENLNELVKSRDSRQMMLPMPPHAPYYYVPYRQYYQPQHQQPSMAQNFDYLSDLLSSLDPGTKERLLSTLMTLADKFQQGNQPLDLSGFKSHNLNELPADLLSTFLDEDGQLPAEFQNASPEEIKALVESRLAFGQIAGSVASVVSYIVQAIIAALFPSTPSTQSLVRVAAPFRPGFRGLIFQPRPI